MISTKGISGTGLKKCIPTTLSGFKVDFEISPTLRLEVFVASMVCSFVNESRDLKISFLDSSFLVLLQ